VKAQFEAVYVFSRKKRRKKKSLQRQTGQISRQDKVALNSITQAKKMLYLHDRKPMLF